MKYCRKLGVERLILYDNGSQNYPEMEEALKAGPDDMDVVLIPWPFNYRPIRSFYNKFCQAGQSNHANQCIGQAEWCGYFDLDEYPVDYKHQNLVKILKNQSRWVGLLRIDSYLSPNILSDEVTSLPTARDFRYRDKQPRKKGINILQEQRR